MRRSISLAGLSALALLAACSGSEESNVSRLDNAVAMADMDPAVTRAIEGEIMVDPNLVNSSNANLVRTTEGPLQADYPLAQGGGGQSGGGASQSGNASASTGQGSATRGAMTRAAIPGPDGPMAGACGRPFDYGNQWAQRLPAAFGVFPGGQITEAAGNDAGNCRIRVVTFTTGENWQRVMDFYRGQATRAGYDAEHEVRGADHMLGGTNAATDGAYVVILTPRQSGTEVALIANNGR